MLEQMPHNDAAAQGFQVPKSLLLWRRLHSSHVGEMMSAIIICTATVLDPVWLVFSDLRFRDDHVANPSGDSTTTRINDPRSLI